MEKKDDKTNLPAKQADNDGKTDLPGYPSYPDSEDIYIKDKEEENIDPEDISKTKESGQNSKAGKRNEKDIVDDKSGSDLDVPGSELDDAQEKVGNEDEENNYYSIGGDDHDDLDEDKGD
ncbi:MAG TPA: hypothetical protein VIK14_04585 [Ignavibacteria bacterium]